MCEGGSDIAVSNSTPCCFQMDRGMSSYSAEALFCSRGIIRAGSLGRSKQSGGKAVIGELLTDEGLELGNCLISSVY